eukprot:scaffold220438_cov36-Tisochrysis_lutea.AAC.1
MRPAKAEERSSSPIRTPPARDAARETIGAGESTQSAQQREASIDAAASRTRKSSPFSLALPLYTCSTYYEY